MKNIKDLITTNSGTLYRLVDNRTKTTKRYYSYSVDNRGTTLSNLSFDQIPIINTTSQNIYNTHVYTINDVPIIKSFITGSLPVKYLPSILELKNGVACFSIGTGSSKINFQGGNSFLKDVDTNEILILGVVSTKYIGLNGYSFNSLYRIDDNNSGVNSVFSTENLTRLEKDLKERKNPIKIYVNNTLFTNPKYKNLLKEILYYIQLINENKYIPVIITNNILSQVKVGYSFPKFATMDEMESFLNKVLMETIENIKT